MRSTSGFFGDLGSEPIGQDFFLRELNDPEYGGDESFTDQGSDRLGEWGDLVPSSYHDQIVGCSCSLDEKGLVACDACGA